MEYIVSIDNFVKSRSDSTINVIYDFRHVKSQKHVK